MKGTRQKYIEHVVRKLHRLVERVELYLLLPDEDDRVEEAFYKLKNKINEFYNQLHEH